LLAGLVAGASAQAFGESDTDVPIVAGGNEAPEGKYPWQVRIYSNMDDTEGFCGGSIIAPQWILTAGHCVKNSDAVVVGYGSNDRTQTKKIESE
jgi:secreted trypsin-like serine protease